MATLVLVAPPADANDQAAGAEVRIHDVCNMVWLTSTGEQTRVAGTGVFVGMPNGEWNLTCVGDLDLEDPSLASIAFVCFAVPALDCHGQGAVSDDGDFLACITNEGIVPVTKSLATPSGKRILTCHSTPH